MRIDLCEKVLATDYYPPEHRLVGDANMLNGRKVVYERRDLEVPGYLQRAYDKSMKMLNGARLNLGSDPARKRKK